jgi:uncharacterized protein (TIGR00730 family)
MQTVCVFSGSSPGARPAYTAAARDLGRELALRGLRVVYGGARVGLMGELADAALEAGAHVTGVIPRALLDKEIGHHGLSELRVTASMHERKAVMADLADGFVALPGGWGTLDELAEVVTWTQLGLQSKPCGLLDVEDYFAGLLEFLRHAVAERFIREEHSALIQRSSKSAPPLDAMERWVPPQSGKWRDMA